MECALAAGVGRGQLHPGVHRRPTPAWEKRARDAKLPIVGDDVEGPAGATIVHRALTNLFRQRGVDMKRTYQLNTGGNTDFLNMTDRNRLKSKKTSRPSRCSRRWKSGCRTRTSTSARRTMCRG